MVPSLLRSETRNPILPYRLCMFRARQLPLLPSSSFSLCPLWVVLAPPSFLIPLSCAQMVPFWLHKIWHLENELFVHSGSYCSLGLTGQKAGRPIVGEARANESQSQLTLVLSPSYLFLFCKSKTEAEEEEGDL